MCLIIDVNTISKVFDPTNGEHDRFKPVAAWVRYGSGSAICGGTKYLYELGRGKYLALFAELRRARRVVSVDSKAVDDFAAALKVKIPDKDFDDEHIVALVAVSKACLVCTDDVRSIPYLKRSDLYPPGVRIPHIYRSLKDAKHCCSRSIVKICPNREGQLVRGKKPKSRPKVKFFSSAAGN